MPENLPKGVRDLRGQVFTSLTPLFVIENKPGYGAIWRCACACGGSHDVLSNNLTSGRVRRCQECARSHRVVQLADARQLRDLARRSGADETGGRTLKALIKAVDELDVF